MHTIIPRKTTKLSFGLLFNSLWFSYDPNAWTLSLSLGTQNLHFSCVFPQSKWALSDFVKLPAVRHSLSCLIGHYGSGRAPVQKKRDMGVNVYVNEVSRRIRSLTLPSAFWCLGCTYCCWWRCVMCNPSEFPFQLLESYCFQNLRSIPGYGSKLCPHNYY